MNLSLALPSILAAAVPTAGAPAAGTSVITPMWWIAPIASVVALFFAWFFYKKMAGASAGTPRMQEIAGYVREGAMAYLMRQYKVVGMVFIALVVVLAGLAYAGLQNPFVPVAFLTGGIFSAICGFIGMHTATRASPRTAQGASESLNRGLQVSFRAGAVMGLVVVGFGLLDICLWYLVLDQVFFTAQNMQTGLSFLGLTLVHPGTTDLQKLHEITATMITFGMGASTQALFARVGGGIYTKAADVGADLVGKVEAGIPEDDPRNPATIADNVGDNVGDVAGMGADLYESFCGSILATAALGAALGAEMIANKTGDFANAIGLVVAPMIVAAFGTVLSIIGIFMVRTKEGATQKQLLRSLLTGTLGSSVLILVVLAVMANMGMINWGIFGAVTTGLVAGILIGQATEYHTSGDYGPTKEIVDQSRMGPATTIISGLANGMYSTLAPVLVIVIGILVAFPLAGGLQSFSQGLYGVGFAAVGMLATLGITLATDAYGPIADNAGGNAEMAGLGKEVRRRTDALDALGNTTAATGKGFAIGSAALTALALLAAYIEEIKLWIHNLARQAGGVFQFGSLTFTSDPAKASDTVTLASTATLGDFTEAFDLTIMNPLLLGGVFIGAMTAFVFCAMTMKAVGRAAGSMVEEVRRQFREKPGIMQGTDLPDYARCVAISTSGAQKEMIVPSFMAIVIPIATGLILGIAGVMGLLAGGLTAGFCLATMLNNAGGSWDNAKKSIEAGENGGKGSDSHKATVVGDTVGDPCKDTSGPSLNILIKLMSMVSLVFAPFVLKLYPSVQSLLFKMLGVDAPN